MAAKVEGVEGGVKGEVRVSSCKLLYIEWVNNKSYYIAQKMIVNIL